MHAHVGRRPAEDAARDLQRVPNVDPLVRADGAVAQIDVSHDLGERKEDRFERRIEGADVRKRIFDLNSVVERDVDLLEEGAFEADGDLELAVPDDGGVRRRVDLDEEREDVELRANEARGARFEEPRLLQLEPEPLFRQRFDGSFEVVDAHRVEDGARLESDAEVAKATQEIVIFPPRDGVEVRFDLVDLDATAQRNLAEARGLDLDDERDHRMWRRRLRQRRHDVDGAEHLEIEQRLRGRVDLGRRVRRPLFDVHGAAKRGLWDFLRPRAAAVRVQPRDRDRAKRAERAGDHLEAVVGRVLPDVDLGLYVRRRVGVSDVGEGSLDRCLRLLELVLVEAFAWGHGGLSGCEDGVDGRLREPVQPGDDDMAVQRGGPFVDDDLDADMLVYVVKQPRDPRVRVEEPLGSIEAFDPRHVALEHRLVVDRVVVRDALEQVEELRRGGGREVVLDVARPDRLRVLHVDRVNRRPPCRDFTARRSA